MGAGGWFGEVKGERTPGHQVQPLGTTPTPVTGLTSLGSAVPRNAQSVVQGTASVLLGFVMDRSSYPARCQHFHFHGISEAWLLKDRGVGWWSGCRCHFSLTELLGNQRMPQAAAWELVGDALLGSGIVASVCHER